MIVGDGSDQEFPIRVGATVVTADGTPDGQDLCPNARSVRGCARTAASRGTARSRTA